MDRRGFLGMLGLAGVAVALPNLPSLPIPAAEDDEQVVRMVDLVVRMQQTSPPDAFDAYINALSKLNGDLFVECARSSRRVAAHLRQGPFRKYNDFTAALITHHHKQMERRR